MAPASIAVTVTVRVRNYAKETRRARIKYRRERRKLIDELGGKCVDCGITRKSLLEFDHLEPRTWCTRNLNRLSRLRRYRQEAAAGLIELRCRPCNASKGAPIDPTAEVEW